MKMKTTWLFTLLMMSLAVRSVLSEPGTAADAVNGDLERLRTAVCVKETHPSMVLLSIRIESHAPFCSLSEHAPMPPRNPPVTRHRRTYFADAALVIEEQSWWKETSHEVHQQSDTDITDEVPKQACRHIMIALAVSYISYSIPILLVARKAYIGGRAFKWVAEISQFNGMQFSTIFVSCAFALQYISTVDGTVSPVFYLNCCGIAMQTLYLLAFFFWSRRTKREKIITSAHLILGISALVVVKISVEGSANAASLSTIFVYGFPCLAMTEALSKWKVTELKVIGLAVFQLFRAGLWLSCANDTFTKSVHIIGCISAAVQIILYTWIVVCPKPESLPADTDTLPEEKMV